MRQKLNQAQEYLMDISNIIVAFDLHGVVLTPEWSSVLRAIWEFKHKLHIFGVIFKPRMLWLSFKLLFNHPTDEEFFTIINHYSPKLMPLALSIMNSHKPIDGTVDIMHRLKRLGYELHVLSNIGPCRYHNLTQKFPELMRLFNAAKINNGNGLAIQKKPQPAFYRDYLSNYNPHDKTVVFIDNEKANLTTIDHNKMIGIHFKCPADLECQLRKLNILHQDVL